MHIRKLRASVRSMPEICLLCTTNVPHREALTQKATRNVQQRAWEAADDVGGQLQARHGGRSVSATRRTRRRVYSRRIAPSTASDPDCTGTCRYANTPGGAAPARTRSRCEPHACQQSCSSSTYQLMESTAVACQFILSQNAQQCTSKPIVIAAQLRRTCVVFVCCSAAWRTSAMASRCSRMNGGLVMPRRSMAGPRRGRRDLAQHAASAVEQLRQAAAQVAPVRARVLAGQPHLAHLRA